MTLDQACQILRAELAANFTGCRLAYENEKPAEPWPPKDSQNRPLPWALVEFRGGMGEQVSLGAPGANDHEDLGAMVVHVFTPKGGGDAMARQLCDSIVTLFRSREIGGVDIGDIFRDDAGPATEDGSTWRRSVRVEFEFRALA